MLKFKHINVIKAGDNESCSVLRDEIETYVKDLISDGTNNSGHAVSLAAHATSADKPPVIPTVAAQPVNGSKGAELSSSVILEEIADVKRMVENCRQQIERLEGRLMELEQQAKTTPQETSWLHAPKPSTSKAARSWRVQTNR